MNGIPEWKERLIGRLEPILSQPDPRPGLSAYHDMPFAIFRYDPEDEFPVRQEIGMLATRLVQGGKRVTRVSLAECLDDALAQAGVTGEALADAERRVGLPAARETVHHLLGHDAPLEDLVAAQVPADATPTRDLVFIHRAGALFGVYRTSSLLEQLKGKVHVPTVLFYPGSLDGPAGLCFMGILDPEHNYRVRIF